MLFYVSIFRRLFSYKQQVAPLLCQFEVLSVVCDTEFLLFFNILWQLVYLEYNSVQSKLLRSVLKLLS
jgi:hypothetical protein